MNMLSRPNKICASIRKFMPKSNIIMPQIEYNKLISITANKYKIYNKCDMCYKFYNVDKYNKLKNIAYEIFIV